MVIFHSYVSLPEGKTKKSLCWSKTWWWCVLFLLTTWNWWCKWLFLRTWWSLDSHVIHGFAKPQLRPGISSYQPWSRLFCRTGMTTFSRYQISTRIQSNNQLSYNFVYFQSLVIPPFPTCSFLMTTSQFTVQGYPRVMFELMTGPFQGSRMILPDLIVIQIN